MNAADDKTPGSEIGTDFYLWHLQHLGIVTPDFATPLWDRAKKKTKVRVAIIDNGADIGHPNLAGACKADEVVDFSSHLYGTIYGRKIPDCETFSKAIGSGKSLFGQLKVRLKALGVDAGKKGALKDIVDALIKAENKSRELPLHDPSRYFAAHGTACAGLVGGRPGTLSGTDTLAGAIPYFGVNPYCEILPICTPYSHEFLPVIHALLYAVVWGADVILMPRGLHHIGDRSAVPGVARHGSRIENGKGDAPLVEGDQADRKILADQMAAFEFLIAALSKKLYIVLAAGNDGFEEALSYPASLIGGVRVGDLDSKSGKGKVGPGFIPVGAENRNGKPSAYSNGKTRKDILHILSDDSVVVQQGLLRFDTKSQFAAEYDQTPHFKEPQANDYSPWGILSLDVRGAYGYESGDGDGAYEHATEWDRQSLYTVFGGTSCASALAAGMIALGLQAGKLQGNAVPIGVSDLKAMFDEWRSDGTSPLPPKEM